MTTNRKQDRKKKAPAPILVFAAVLVSVCISLFFGQNGMLRLRTLKSDYNRKMQENHQLAMENRKLMEEIRSLQQDATAVERIAREELNLVSPHDLVLIVPEEDLTTTTQ